MALPKSRILRFLSESHHDPIVIPINKNVVTANHHISLTNTIREVVPFAVWVSTRTIRFIPNIVRNHVSFFLFCSGYSEDIPQQKFLVNTASQRQWLSSWFVSRVWFSGQVPPSQALPPCYSLQHQVGHELRRYNLEWLRHSEYREVFVPKKLSG